MQHSFDRFAAPAELLTSPARARFPELLNAG
jgi:hypothetical protein